MHHHIANKLRDGRVGKVNPIPRTLKEAQQRRKELFEGHRIGRMHRRDWIIVPCTENCYDRYKIKNAIGVRKT